MKLIASQCWGLNPSLCKAVVQEHWGWENLHRIQKNCFSFFSFDMGTLGHSGNERSGHASYNPLPLFNLLPALELKLLELQYGDGELNGAPVWRWAGQAQMPHFPDCLYLLFVFPEQGKGRKGHSIWHFSTSDGISPMGLQWCLVVPTGPEISATW